MEPEPFGEWRLFRLGPSFRLFVLRTRVFKTTTLELCVHRTLGPEATRLSLLAAVLQRGCQGYPTMRAISQFLEEMYGASFSCDVDRVGERMILSLSLRVLQDRFTPRRAHTLERGLDFLARMLLRPRLVAGEFPADLVAQEKENLVRFLESLRDDRIQWARLRLIQRMFAGEPYAWCEHGVLEEVRPLTSSDLVRFHRTLLLTAPVDLLVCGDIDPGRLARRVARVFARLVRRPAVEEPRPPISATPNTLREFRESAEMEQAKLALGFRTGRTLRDPLFPGIAVFAGMLGGFPHARLFTDLREKRGLCYYAQSSLDATKGAMFAEAGVDPSRVALARDAILGYVDELRRGRFSDEELDAAKKAMVQSLLAQRDSPADRISACLEQAVNAVPMTLDHMVRELQRVDRDCVLRASEPLRPDTVFVLEPK